MLLLFSSQNSYSQNTNKIILVGKTKANSIIIRWAATDFETWQNANLYGVNIERITYQSKSATVIPRIKKNLGNVKPFTVLQWANITPRETIIETAQKLLFYVDDSKIDNPMNKMQSQNMVFGFAMLVADLSENASKGLGLRYTDETVSSDEKYIYRVSINYPDKIKREKSASEAILYIGMKETNPKPEGFQAGYKNKVVNLKWSGKKFSAFNLYRSDDDGKTFSRINKLPILPSNTGNDTTATISHSDTISQLYKTYHYQIKGITPFSDESQSSNTIKVYAFKSEIPIPQNLTHQVVLGPKVTLKWTYPDSSLRDIKGFKVVRSRDLAKGEIEISTTILPNTTRLFVDEKPENLNYYRIKAIDLGDNEVSSSPVLINVLDTIPPNKPQILIGKIDKNGYVKLNWAKNKENDIFGYRVYKANSAIQEFVLDSSIPVKDTSYADTITLKILNKYIYYFIVAVDKSFNPSFHSDTLKLKRPDIFSPAPPVFIKQVSTDSTIFLKWYNSPSEDVVRHELYRYLLPDTLTKRLLIKVDSSNKTMEYLDKEVDDEQVYEYVLEAIDDGNLSSEKACSVKIEKFTSMVKPPIKIFDGDVDNQKKSFKLSWNYQGKMQPSKFVLFKSKDGLPPYMYKIFNDNITEYVDEAIEKGKPYTYTIIVKFGNGSQTKPTKPLIMILDK